MREALKNLIDNDYKIYGILLGNFDHTFDLVKEIIDVRSREYKQYEGAHRKRAA